MAPPDPILGLSEAFAKDDYPQKVILGVGAYRGDDGKPLVLQCVRDAEEIIMGQKLDHEYAGIVGEPKFISHALKFAYGDSSAPLIENRVAGVQTLSGTGGLRVFGELVAKFGHKHIYVPNPTWGNHIPIFTNAGLEVRKYRYYDSKLSSLDFDNMLKDLEDMPKGSIVLLHACAHNPTGMDPTLEQWSTISQICKTRSLLPFFDCAYQCFASGDADQDAQAIRLFVSDGHQIALVQSFSKNFGLYGQRVGALSVIGADEDEAKRVLSQMKIVIRPMYSNPPRHGARIVSAILEDARLRGDFVSQCRGMADRINVMRGELRGGLERAGSNKNWEHVTKQIGMFAYSGLSKEECELLRDKHHVYLTLDGRISMAGVTTANVDYIANAIHDVTK
eukprot:CAMPEP_0172517702 /NCGR_PEP_ID=MMETSP1066-20121228/287204_1 /TAXON_ID=671091 /ORGANISM="Coscinodiscus wailesii, Strain CCMP2513" /LENGTH=391 /DNA_ID=CAMNT_0013299837 /DNA_START=266 /DNA_END=1444 /DNA_ORIENTATION=+